MGRDKAFLPWGRSTLVDHVLDAVRPLVDDVLLVVRDAGRFRRLPVRVAEDMMLGGHALGGIYTGLALATTPHVFVVACDMPFVDTELAGRLIRQRRGYDLVIPRTAAAFEPLHAVYAKSCLPVIRRLLEERRYAVASLVPLVKALVVPHGRVLPNLNTPLDYAAARSLSVPCGSDGVHPDGEAA